MKNLPTCTFLNNIGEHPSSIDSPLQMKLINFLGLKNYMIDNFIFRRKDSKYLIRKNNGRNVLLMSKQKQQKRPQGQKTQSKLQPKYSLSTNQNSLTQQPSMTQFEYQQSFRQEQLEYEPPSNYDYECFILQTSTHSIPVCRLIPRHKTCNTVIVYSHGNASDLSDSLAFIQRLAVIVNVEYFIYDYTGYGESRVPDVGEEIITADLQIILAYLCGNNTHKLQEIILWGFSLGTFPVVVNAAKYNVGAVVLQCPIASISCMFHGQLHPQMKFKEDHFANINYIAQIKSKLFIMHSNGDQIIPFSHAKLLYTKFIMRNGEERIDFIQIGKIRHNSLHSYIVSPLQNELQREVLKFIGTVMYKNADKRNSKPVSSNTIKSAKSLPTQMMSNLTAGNQSYLENEGNMGTSIHHQNLKLQHQLHEQYRRLQQLKMKIVQADIVQIAGDMKEIVIDIDQERHKNRQMKIRQMSKKQQISNDNEAPVSEREMERRWTKRKLQVGNSRWKEMKMKDKLISQKIMKNCFCFNNQ